MGRNTGSSSVNCHVSTLCHPRLLRSERVATATLYKTKITRGWGQLHNFHLISKAFRALSLLVMRPDLNYPKIDTSVRTGDSKPPSFRYSVSVVQNSPPVLQSLLEIIYLFQEGGTHVLGNCLSLCNHCHLNVYKSWVFLFLLDSIIFLLHHAQEQIRATSPWGAVPTWKNSL